MLSIGYVLKIAAAFRANFRSRYLISLLLVSSSAYASQSLEEIHTSSQQYLRDNLIHQGVLSEDIRIKVNFPDKRLRLQQCKQPLSHFIPEYASLNGNTTVAVLCSSPKWQIYLPARVEQLTNVWISTRTIRKGEIVSLAEMKQVKKAKSNRFQPLELNITSSSSFRAAKNINSGYAISNLDLCQICKGDQIELRVKSASFVVKMFGIALKNGVSGEFIPARNNKSKKVVTGRVISQGILEMTL